MAVLQDGCRVCNVRDWPEQSLWSSVWLLQHGTPLWTSSLAPQTCTKTHKLMSFAIFILRKEDIMSCSKTDAWNITFLRHLAMEMAPNMFSLLCLSTNISKSSAAQVNARTNYLVKHRLKYRLCNNACVLVWEQVRQDFQKVQFELHQWLWKYKHVLLQFIKLINNYTTLEGHRSSNSFAFRHTFVGSYFQESVWIIALFHIHCNWSLSGCLGEMSSCAPVDSQDRVHFYSALTGRFGNCHTFLLQFFFYLHF